MTNESNTKKDTMDARRNVLMKALVEAYGDGTVISRKQMIEVWKKNRETFPHFDAIKRNANYIMGRNKFLITLETDVAAVRAKTEQNVAKLEAKRVEKVLPKAVRTNPKKLAKAVLGTTKPVKAAKPEVNTMEGFEQEEESINDIMKQL